MRLIQFTEVHHERVAKVTKYARLEPFVRNMSAVVMARSLNRRGLPHLLCFALRPATNCFEVA